MEENTRILRKVSEIRQRHDEVIETLRQEHPEVYAALLREERRVEIEEAKLLEKHPIFLALTQNKLVAVICIILTIIILPIIVAGFFIRLLSA